ncbi:transporter [Chloroflexota bacterium]
MKNLGREVAVLGVGMHPFGKYPDKSLIGLGTHAVREALKDASLEWKDIQAVAGGNSDIWGGVVGRHPGQYLAKAMGFTGIPIVNTGGACATGGVCISTIANMVATGAIDIGMAVGMDIAPKGFFAVGQMDKEPTKDDTGFLEFRVAGAPNPAYWAFECVKRMEQYGTTMDDLNMSKVVVSRHSVFNPMARFQKVYTKEEVEASPMVNYPFRLLTLCATSDGSAAVILGSVEEARKHTSNPIILAAASVGSPVYDDPTLRLGQISAPAKNGPLVSESVMGVKRAYEMAGMGPDDISFFEIPDNSSWHYLVYTDVVLQAEVGTAEKLLRSGDTAIGGKRPINPSGGFASLGEVYPAQGEAQVYEMTTQLRGQAGQRQVEGAKTALATVYGGEGNNAVVILKK